MPAALIVSNEVSNGDMVVNQRGWVGLMTHLTQAGRAVVQFEQNGTPRYYDPRELRRATMLEIEDAGLFGVGCNQAMDGVE